VVRQEAQLMLTNPHDAFRGQTRSPEMVLFGMLSMVSYYCATVNLSVRHTVSEIFNFKNVVTLKIGLEIRQGHRICHHSIECIGLPKFLSTLYNNYSSILCHFWDIQCRKI